MTGTDVAYSDHHRDLLQAAKIRIASGDFKGARRVLDDLRNVLPPKDLPEVIYPLEEELAKLKSAGSWRVVDKVAWLSFVGVVVASILSAAGGITAAAINNAAPRTECIQALRNVDEALKMGVTDPAILGNLNAPEVDARCGDEQLMKKSLGK